jgi:hypothetical protein
MGVGSVELSDAGLDLAVKRVYTVHRVAFDVAFGGDAVPWWGRSGRLVVRRDLFCGVTSATRKPAHDAGFWRSRAHAIARLAQSAGGETLGMMRIG